MFEAYAGSQSYAGHLGGLDSLCASLHMQGGVALAVVRCPACAPRCAGGCTPRLTPRGLYFASSARLRPSSGIPVFDASVQAYGFCPSGQRRLDAQPFRSSPHLPGKTWSGARRTTRTMRRCGVRLSRGGERCRGELGYVPCTSGPMGRWRRLQPLPVEPVTPRVGEVEARWSFTR